MSGLSWNWLAAPYFACALMLLAAVIAAGVLRGDRVMRLGVIGMGTTAMPWAVCSGIAACSSDPEVATRLLRLGQGPTSLVGPNFMLVLLGLSGQLERRRWLARISGVVGILALGICWATDWIVPGVRLLDSGIYFPTAGPLTDLHVSQLVIWMLIGAFVMRGASSHGEQRRLVRIVIGILALGGIGAIDTLIIHEVWSGFPIAWFPVFVATAVMLYLIVRTDLLRPQGVDRAALVELVGFAIATALVGVVAWALEGATPVIMASAAAIVWVIVLGAIWFVARVTPVREVAGERALSQFVTGLTDVEDEKMIGERITALWKPFAIEVRATWRIEGDQLIDTTGAKRSIDKDVVAWLARHGQAFSPTDLATMRLGEHRAKLEAFVAAHGASLVVPLVDRDVLVGIVEANHADALREHERELVGESARAAARAITYASLARAAAREGATAREVELAEALRLQASASRDDELGRWTVAVEYRTAARTTGAGWSATLLHDGRLAILVTEAQAHGVAAALATAALTGAFAAATVGSKPLELDGLLTSLRASAEGVMRGGEPVAAFIALVDGDRQRVTWATAGHPGAFVVGPVAYDLAKFPLGSTSGPRPKSRVLGGGGGSLGASLVTATRGEIALPHDSLLVIASTAVRGNDEEKFETSLCEQAPAGPRLAQLLVDTAAKRGDSHEDLLAVVVRQRPDRRSEPVMLSTPEPA
ncbi:MAG: SpoIIE family protein phosphatase [Kofleriaceae bacterium]